MFSTLRRSSLPYAATLFVSLLSGCAASRGLETSDNARNPSSVLPDEPAPYAQAPAGAPSLADAEEPSGYAAKNEDDAAGSERIAPAVSQAPSKAAADSSAMGSRETSSARRPSAPSYRPRDERPGLGTTWGETRDSRVHEVSFVRQSSASPLALLRVQYNDQDGLLAQLGEHGFNQLTANYTEPQNRFVSVELVDLNGSPLPGLTTGDRTYVLGHHGDSYAIRVRNHERQRFEIVATVDGLDVIDGSKGSFGKRGYVLNAYDTLLIEGFRRSSQAVAAFRFGSVQNSYSAQSGKGDRNVGVIGIAVFDERHPEPVYNERELELRETADPFPSRYAPPPTSRRAY